ncbi:MAG: GxxExxY protein [Halieaceae bacterium]|jgi:GxxExxY protein
MGEANKDYLFQEETYKIIGAAMAAHSELGSGFLESVYKEALALELQNVNITFTQEEKLLGNYKGKSLNKYFYADFVSYDDIIVELKAISSLLPEHKGQVMNYLKATGYRLGLLINFGAKSLEYKRVIL